MPRKPEPPSSPSGITATLYKEPTPPPRWFRGMHLDLSPSQLALVGFAIIILIGSLLLWLPFAVVPDSANNYLTALFTATSAVCVTGLTVVDVGTYYTNFGQAIILLLIQVGGLGYMVMYSLMLMAVGKRLSLRERFAMKEMMDLPGPGGVLGFVLRVLLVTLIIETIGLLFLASVWVPEYGWGHGLYLSLFHSISAFNNAGFSLFPAKLINYRTNFTIIMTVSTLVIMGGLGYPVLAELWHQIVRSERHLMWRHFSLNTRVGLITSACLLVVGTVMIFLFEMGNPETLANLSWRHQMMAAFFQSAMARTGGYYATDPASLTNASLFLIMLLMFVGCNPSGTGGGVKTTTLAVLLAQAMAVIKGDASITLQHRRLNVATLRKAATTIIISWGLINVVAMILAVTEPKDFLRLMFETVSAFANVGLSAGVTPNLSWAGQLLIITTMYVGRVGVITMGMALWRRKTRSALQYAEESLLVG